MDDRYYDLDGNPVPMREWARLFEARRQGKGIVEQTRLTGGVYVSTVWLGLNHRWGEGPPLIFETLIFDDLEDERMWRYSTFTEAFRHHHQLLGEIMTWRDRVWLTIKGFVPDVPITEQAKERLRETLRGFVPEFPTP